MPKILFIADHRLNRSPSQRYRFEQYLNFFRSNGIDWELSEIISETDDIIFYSSGNYLKKAFILLKSIFIRFRDLIRAKKFDLIFIQREATLLGSSFFEKQFYKKNKVIFDFDDSIWLLDTSPENKKFEFLKNPNKTKINIQHAHIVIAGNSYLARYAEQFNKNIYIIPTTIDNGFHKPKPELRNKEKIVIGWSGSISTIKHFESSIPLLKKLLNKYPNKIEIHVLGQSIYSHPEIEVVSKAWHSASEVDNINCFDIGIMQLPNDEWSKGKCGLKALSYMACGVPTVVSPVGVNEEIIQHGINGFLATTDEDWIDSLSKLIENKELRLQIGLAGLNTVVDKYSVNAHKHKYLELINSLI